MAFQLLGLLAFLLYITAGPGKYDSSSAYRAALNEAGEPLLGDDSGSEDYEVMSDMGRVASLVHVHHHHTHHSHSSDTHPDMGKGREGSSSHIVNEALVVASAGSAAAGDGLDKDGEGEHVAFAARPALAKVKSFAIHDIEAAEDSEQDGTPHAS